MNDLVVHQLFRARGRILADDHALGHCVRALFYHDDAVAVVGSVDQGEEMRVFPISNWTEKDIWQYIQRENIDIVPLYFAAERPFVRRNGNIIMVDDDRMRLEPGEKIEHGKIRFRTLGCYPLTGGIESDADTLDAIIDETLSAVSSERTSRVIDSDGGAASMEKRKREGYF